MSAARRCGHVVTVEDGVVQGGFGSAVLELLAAHGATVPTAIVGLPDHFIEHGPVPKLRELVGLTAEEVARKAAGLLSLPLPVRPFSNGAATRVPEPAEKSPVSVR